MSVVVSPGTGERNRRRPKVCEGCGKRFVSAGVGPTPEGTVRHKARGKCSSCYDRNRRGTETFVPRSMQPCSECGALTCPRSRKPEPGERHYGGKGLCDLCYERAYRESGRRNAGRGTRADLSTVTDVDERRTEWNTAGLVSYIRARRARGWPDDGTLRGIVA